MRVSPVRSTMPGTCALASCGPSVGMLASTTRSTVAASSAPSRAARVTAPTKRGPSQTSSSFCRGLSKIARACATVVTGGSVFGPASITSLADGPASAAARLLVLIGQPYPTAGGRFARASLRRAGAAAGQGSPPVASAVVARLPSPAARRHAAVLVGALLLCPLAALVIGDDPQAPVQRARALMGLERALGIYVEPSVSAWALRHHAVLTVAGLFYVFAH